MSFRLNKLIPNNNVYSFLKDLYTTHMFLVNTSTTYFELPITNIPYGSRKSAYTQIADTFPQTFNVDVIVIGNLEVNSKKINGYQYARLGDQNAIAVKGLGEVFVWLVEDNPFPDYISLEQIMQNVYAYDVYLHTLPLHEAVLQYVNYGIIIPDSFFEDTGINEVLKYLKYGCVTDREKFALGTVIMQILYPNNPFNLNYGTTPGETYQQNLNVTQCAIDGYLTAVETSEQLSEFEVVVSEQFSEIQSEFSQFESEVSEQFSEIESEFAQFESEVSEQFSEFESEFASFEEYTSEEFSDVFYDLISESESIVELSEYTTEQASYLNTQIQNLQQQINTLFTEISELIAQNSEARFNLYFSVLTQPTLNNFTTALSYVVKHYDDTYLLEGLTQANLYNWVQALVDELIASNFTSVTSVANEYPCYAQETQTLQTYLNQSVSAFAQQLLSFVQSQTQNLLGQQQESRALSLLGIILEFLAIYGDYYVRQNNTSEYLNLMSNLVTQGLYYTLGVKFTFTFKIPYTSEAYVESAIVQSACKNAWVTFNAQSIISTYHHFRKPVIALYDSYQNFTSIASTYFQLAQNPKYVPIANPNLFFANELMIGILLEDAYALSQLGYAPACPNQQNVSNANNVLGSVLGTLVSTLTSILNGVLSTVLNLLNGILGLL